MTAAAPGRRERALRSRVAQVEAALARGGTRLPEDVTAPVRRAVEVVGERLALGVDHTVVALVGGTGSGKSSLFNAVSGLRLADVGARRPTTSRVTACAWSHEAGPLLDWLGVERDRRMERESELDGESEADLRGLVLLDLPDHDSVAPEHREVVDRLLPMVDLLVWVVDPQKYADDALHTGYLRHLVGHEQSMVVVLNQVDTVPVTAREELLADVGRLLEADGLSDVPVHGVSALDGTGVRALRASLTAAVAGRGAVATRARAELDTAVRALAAHTGGPEPVLDGPAARTTDALTRALGLPAVVDLLAAGAAARPLAAPSAEAVEEALEEWRSAVTGDLPRLWTEALEGAVPQAVAVASAVAGAASEVPAPAGAPRHPLRARVVDALARGAARRRHEAAAAAYDAAVRAAVAGVVERDVVVPARAVLEDHVAVRVLVQEADRRGGPPSPAPDAAPSSTDEGVHPPR